MSGLDALGIAANIFAVIDFSTQFIKHIQQIIKDGSVVEHTDLKKNAEDLRKAVGSLGKSAQSTFGSRKAISSEDGKDLQAIMTRCDDISHDLLSSLDSLTASPDPSPWQAMMKAIQTMWKKDKIESVSKRLADVREQLHLRVTIIVSSKQDDMLLALDEDKRLVIEAILDQKKFLRGEFQEQTTVLSGRLDHSDATRSREHQETMGAISGVHLRLDTAIRFTGSNTPDQDKIRQTILDCLKFSSMTNRFEDIEEAHRKTFNWIFEDRKEKRPFDDFVGWAENGKGVYWVTGKAGSGKSTLMKYLNEDPRTRDALEKWAGDVPLRMISFYFWSSGSMMQRSRKGLLQGILHNILLEEPELSPILFPHQHGNRPMFEEFPSHNDLKRAYRHLVEQTAVDMRLAILIDGLDEYDTETDKERSEITQILSPAFSSANIKMVLSSRPLPEFEDCFSICPKLRLHQLTEKDIASYVSDTIRSHSHMKRLEEKQPWECKRLINKIINTAAGVFLWVNLAVKSLLSGLRNCDRIENLQDRLEELPPDLENLIKHMYESIEPRYRGQVSRVIQLLRCIEGTPGRNESLFTPGPFPALMISFACEVSPNCTLDGETMSLTEAGMVERLSELERLLSGSFRGLLELRRWEPRARPSIKAAEPGIFRSREKIEVGFVHKSVVDFLEKPEIRKGIIAETEGVGFDPPLALLRFAVMLLKARPCIAGSLIDVSRGMEFGPVMADVLSAGVRVAMKYAKQIEITANRTEETLLDDLDCSMAIHLREWTQQLTEQQRKDMDNAFVEATGSKTSMFEVSWCDLFLSLGLSKGSEPWQTSFLCFCAYHGLDLYVQAKIRKDPRTPFHKPGMPLLVYPFLSQSFSLSRSLVLLIEKDHDLRRQFCGYNAWKHWLGRILYNIGHLRSDLWRAFIKAGADINVTVEYPDLLNDERWIYATYATGTSAPEAEATTPASSSRSDSTENSERKQKETYVHASALMCYRLGNEFYHGSEFYDPALTHLLSKGFQYRLLGVGNKNYSPPERTLEQLKEVKEIDDMFVERGAKACIWRGEELIYPLPGTQVPEITIESVDDSTNKRPEDRSPSPAISSRSKGKTREKIRSIFHRSEKKQRKPEKSQNQTS